MGGGAGGEWRVVRGSWPAGGGRVSRAAVERPGSPCDIRGALRRAFINRSALRQADPGIPVWVLLPSSSTPECHWSLGCALAARPVPQQPSPSNRSDEPISLLKHYPSPCRTRDNPLGLSAAPPPPPQPTRSTQQPCIGTQQTRGKASAPARGGPRSLENSRPATSHWAETGFDAIGCGLHLLTPAKVGVGQAPSPLGVCVPIEDSGNAGSSEHQSRDQAMLRKLAQA